LEELEEMNTGSDGAQQYLTLPGANGARIPCVPSMEDVGYTVVIGGVEEVISSIVLVRKSHFVTVDLTNITIDVTTLTVDNSTPRLRSLKKPTFRTKTYRVLKVQEDPSEAYFKVFLGSAK
jgi:hypothetical protein